MPRYWEILAKLKKEPTEMDKIRSGTLSYTGRGENGILEPSKPAGVDYSSGKPIMLHEGETIEATRGGKLVTPARLVPFNTEEEQEMAKIAEKRLRIPGMQTGGYIPTFQNEQSTPIDILGKNNQLRSPVTAVPTMPNATNTTPSIVPTTPNMTPSITPITSTKGLLGLGMDTTKNIVTGQNSVFDINKNQMLGRLGASQAAQTGAMQQNVAQQGLSAPVFNVLGANLQRQQNIAQGQVASELATQEANAQQQAAKDLYTMASNDFSMKKSQIDDLLALGGQENILKAEQMAKDLYGFGVDYSKASLPDLQSNMQNIEEWIKKYGADAPPDVLELFGKKYFDAWEQSNAIQGLSFSPEEKQTILQGLINGDEDASYSGLQLGSSVIDWWDQGEGSPLKLMLSGQMKQYQSILTDKNATASQKEEASQALGQLVGTAYYAAKGYGDYLSDEQKALLENSGLGILTNTQSKKNELAEKKKADIQDYLTGGKEDWVNAYKDPEIWEAVKGMVPELGEYKPGTVMSAGITKIALGDQGNVTGISALNNLKTGTMVKYKGKAFVVKDKELNEKGKDYVTYVFMSPDTGKEYRIKLGKASGFKNLTIVDNELENV